MYVCVPSACSVHGGKREHRISWNCNGWRFRVTMLVLGAGLEFFPRTASSLLSIAGLSPYPWTLLLMNRGSQEWPDKCQTANYTNQHPFGNLFIRWIVNGDQIASRLYGHGQYSCCVLCCPWRVMRKATAFQALSIAPGTNQWPTCSWE